LFQACGKGCVKGVLPKSKTMKKAAATGQECSVNSWIIAHFHIAAAGSPSGLAMRTPPFGQRDLKMSPYHWA
jgi:hypothetical protein